MEIKSSRINYKKLSLIDLIIFLVFIVVTIMGLGMKEGLKYIFIIMTLFCISKTWERWKLKKEEDGWRKYKESLPEEERKEAEKFEESLKKNEKGIKN